MKKYTNRLAIVTLICVPFLIVTVSLAQTEESIVKTDVSDTTTTDTTTTDTTTTDTTTIENSVVEQTKETVKWDKVSLKLVETAATGVVDKSHGKFKLADVQDNVLKELNLSGHFKEINNSFISLSNTGEWSAIKTASNEKLSLDYILDKETQEKLNEFYPDRDFSKPFKTEQINLNFSEEKKADEIANISLEIVGGPLEAVEGNSENGKSLKVKVKGGSDVTGGFTVIDSKVFILDKDGNYSIPKEARYEKLNQEVEFTLDKASYDKLVDQPENSGKTVEKVYKINVTKKAQKDIVIKFKNKGITTVVGGQGRLLLEDTIEGVKIQEIEKVKFKPLENNDFLSIDEIGNWKALKTGNGPLKPAIILDDKTIAALEAEFKDYDITIESQSIDVVITKTGTSGKTYEPVKILPKTGEEKLRFASIGGVLLLILVGIFFLIKKKKNRK